MKFNEMNRHFHFSCQAPATESGIWNQKGHKGRCRAVKLLAYLSSWLHSRGGVGKQDNNIANFPHCRLQLLGETLRQRLYAANGPALLYVFLFLNINHRLK